MNEWRVVECRTWNRERMVMVLALLVFCGLAAACFGCSTLDSLRSPEVEKVCTSRICYLRTTAENVHLRCTKGKRLWDDGSLFDPLDTTKRARACVTFPRGAWGSLLRLHPRYHIWISPGNEDAIPHEQAHIEQYELDGAYIPANHAKISEFGFGRTLKSYLHTNTR